MKVTEEKTVIEDLCLMKSLRRLTELSDFFETEYDLSNQDFIEALSQCESLTIHGSRNPITEDTLQELNRLLVFMPSLRCLNITSRGVDKIDVTSIFDAIRDNIEIINLTGVNFNDSYSFNEEKFPQLKRISIEDSDISHIPNVQKKDCLLSFGGSLPNISNEEYLDAIIDGKNIHIRDNDEIMTIYYAYHSLKEIPIELLDENHLAYLSKFGARKINVAITDVSQLDSNKLEELTKKIPNINAIKLTKGWQPFGALTSANNSYSLEEYLQIRNIMEEMASQIVFPDEYDPDREKKIFTQIYVLLGEMISYDHQAISEEGQKDMQLQVDCRNLKNVFLGKEIDGRRVNEGVCAAYSTSLYNMASMLGIDCEYIESKSPVEFESRNGGYFEKQNEEGKVIHKNGTTDPMPHAYNYVVLDGKKYYCDLTWDATYIQNGLFPLPHFLNSYNDFYKSHEDEGFSEKIGDVSATESYPFSKQIQLLSETQKYSPFIEQVEELEELMKRNYLCGFVKECVDYYKGGRTDYTIDQVHTIWSAITQIEDYLMEQSSEHSHTMVQFDSEHTFTFDTSNQITLNNLKNEIQKRREENHDGR